MKIVLFSDLAGPFDRRLQPLLDQMLQEYRDKVSLTFRHFTYQAVKLPYEAAAAAAAQGKFWQMHSVLLSHRWRPQRADMEGLAAEVGLDLPRFRAALDAGAARNAIEADLKLAREMSVKGSPTLFINGKPKQGVSSYEELKAAIEGVLHPPVARAAAPEPTPDLVISEPKVNQSGHEMATEAARRLRRDKRAAVASARAAAIKDGQRAGASSKPVDMTVFGVPLGSALTIPECTEVGRWERGPGTAPIIKKTSGYQSWGNAARNEAIENDIEHDVMVSAQTCLLLKKDGSTAIHWGENAIPDWAQTVDLDLDDDVAVSVRIAIQSGARRYVRETISAGGIVGVALAQSSANIAQRDYDVLAKAGPEHVEAALGQLSKKYGPPSKRRRIKLAARPDAEDLQWSLPGLHVQYTPDDYEDALLIELDSVYSARSEKTRKREAYEPRL